MPPTCRESVCQGAHCYRKHKGALLSPKMLPKTISSPQHYTFILILRPCGNSTVFSRPASSSPVNSRKLLGLFYSSCAHTPARLPAPCWSWGAHPINSPCSQLSLALMCLSSVGIHCAPHLHTY